jgi:hypothetical protein
VAANTDEQMGDGHGRMSLTANQRALLFDEGLLGGLTDSVTVVDREARVMATTAELGVALGYPSETWVGRQLAELIHPDDLGPTRAAIDHLSENPELVSTGDLRVQHALGHWETVRYRAVNRLDTPSRASSSPPASSPPNANANRCARPRARSSS